MELLTADVLCGCYAIGTREQFPEKKGQCPGGVQSSSVLGVMGHTWKTTPGHPTGCHMMLHCPMFPEGPGSLGEAREGVWVPAAEPSAEEGKVVERGREGGAGYNTYSWTG